MSTGTALAPTIPGSTSYETNFTRYLQADTIITAGTSTDKVATFRDNRLVGLLEPVDAQDAATKEYVDDNIPGVSPPVNSIQYNVDNAFTGNSSLTLIASSASTVSTLLYSHSTITGSINHLYITNGMITGITAPTATSNPVNKSFVDYYYNLNIIGITTAGVTYAPTQMVVSIINRSFSNTANDLTATAANIVSYLGATNSLLNVNTSLVINNLNTTYTDLLRLQANTRVTIYPSSASLTIPPGYTLNAYMSITNNGSGTEQVGLFVTSLVPRIVGPNPTFQIKNRGTCVQSDVTRISSLFSTYTESNTVLGQTLMYNQSHLLGILCRNHTSDMEDSFGPVSTFISGYNYINSSINYIYSSGAVQFIVKNKSTGSSLVVTESTGWTLDPNSNMTIGPEQTGMFFVDIDTENETGYVSVIGIA